VLESRQRRQLIQARLGSRRLVFFGTRGTDAKPLLDLPSLEAVFCQIAPLQALGLEEVCLETLKQVRVDLNRYSIDDDRSDAVSTLRAGLLRAFGRPAAVVPYRPSEVLASAWFPRADRVEYLGVFHEKQACFEHKPWVETQLQRLGVRVVPWTYYSDDDQGLILEAVETGPLVLRANRSDGGAGLNILRPGVELDRRWPAHGDGFLAAAPFLEPNIPLNVNACVYPEGKVVMHPPSVQLIGLEPCTNRTFGYCGNDFARVGDLDAKALDDLEEITRTVGRWLASQGYLGVFGVDALLYDATVYLVEVNPRFQGSSCHAAEIVDLLGRPNLFLDHLGAFLGLEPPNSLSLRELSRFQEETPLSHVICYNRQYDAISPQLSLGDNFDLACDLLPARGVSVEPEGVLVQVTFPSSVTKDGFSLSNCAASRLWSILSNVYPGIATPASKFKDHAPAG